MGPALGQTRVVRICFQAAEETSTGTLRTLSEVRKFNLGRIGGHFAGNGGEGVQN